MIKKIILGIFILMLSVFGYSAEASVLGTITTDKDTYNINDTITIDYSISSDGYTYETDINVIGVLPSYNGVFMKQETYFGKKLFDKYTNGHPYFKTSGSYRLADRQEGGQSSFQQISSVDGTITTMTHSAVYNSNQYRNFLGKVIIETNNLGLYTTINITREQPMVLLTNQSMIYKNAYIQNDTVVISYFCKNLCKIYGIDILNSTSEPIFVIGIDSTNALSLTTSDTGEWKQVELVINELDFTPNNNNIKVVIEDNKGNTDSQIFFTFIQTDDIITVSNQIHDVGTNELGFDTFNSSLNIVYRTPDETSDYRLQLDTSGQTGCEDGLDFPYRFELGRLLGVVTPNNGGLFINLDGSEESPYNNIYYGMYQSLLCVDYIGEDTNITVTSNLKLQQKQYYGWFETFPHWSTIGNVDVTFKAYRSNMISNSLFDFFPGISIDENPNAPTVSIKPIIEAFGFKGALGHLIFAVISLFFLFIGLSKVKIHSFISLSFIGFVIWYYVYDGIIDSLILVFVILFVIVMYTTKLLKFLRTDENEKLEGEI